jgi:hypothetical protein
MRSSACSVVLSLLLLCFTTSVFAQAPVKQAVVKTPRGSVSGRVMIKDKPAPGVVVGLKRADNMNPYEQYSKANTDHDGFYRITGIASGSYNVIAVAPGYVVSDVNNARQVVVIGEDENIDDINFTLVRGGVITGKITDADGKPMIQTLVTVYRTEFVDKQRPPFQEATGQTDDRGIYRIFGLMPGKFKVAAGRSDDSPSFAGFGRTYKQVFHPDATDIAKATTIEIGEGGEAKNIDITLGRAVQTFSISGRVINEAGSPVPDVRFGLQRIVGDRPEYMATNIVSNLRGDFVAEGLSSGKYTIIQFANGTSDFRVESSTFDVIDQDVTDLTIRLVKGASISGFMVIESDDKALRSRLPELRLQCFVQPSSGAPTSSASSLIGPDGSFRLAGLQTGTANIMIGGVNAPYPPRGFSIARIERDGAVVPRFEIRDGENVTGVRVILTYGSGTVRGVITLENGTLPPGARFFVRVSKPGENNLYLRPPTVDARGHFMMEGIPTGIYELTAQVTGFKGTQPAPVKRTVNVTDGMVTDVAITIDMGGLSPTNP